MGFVLPLLPAIIGGVTSIGGALLGRKKTPEMKEPEALPPAPDPEAAAKKARTEQIEKRRKSFTRAETILTGPRGLEEKAPTERKTLLGI